MQISALSSMQSPYIYNYIYKVKRVEKETLCSDFDRTMSTRSGTEHMLHKFRFAVLDLNEPDPVNHLVHSFMQKLFRQSQPQDSSSDEPAVPVDHQHLLSLKITDVANAALANGIENHRAIQILVIFTIKWTTKRDDSDGIVIVGKECVICLQKFKNEYKVIQFPCDCKSFLHEECADKWVKKNPSCPTCRFSIANYL